MKSNNINSLKVNSLNINLIGIEWNTLLNKPGVIIPELDQSSRDTEKMEQFLVKLTKPTKD